MKPCLGLLLVIGDTGVLEPVAPEDFIWKIGGADLEINEYDNDDI